MSDIKIIFKITSQKRIAGLALLFFLLMTGYLSAQNTSWTGAVSNLWSNAANWSNGVPGSNTNVSIPYLPPTAFQPVININTTFKSLNMTSLPNTLSVADGINVTINNDIKIGNTATFNVGNGNVTINGEVSTGGNIKLNNGTMTFKDKFEYSGGGTVTFEGNGTMNIGTPTVPADFYLGGGNTFNLNNGTLNVYGPSEIAGSGILNLTTGNLNFYDESKIVGNSRFYAGDGNVMFYSNSTISNSAIFYGQSGTITMDGAIWNVSGNSSFNPETSNMVFTSNTQITGLDATFYNVEVEQGVTVSSSVNVLINNDLVADGNFTVIPGKTLNVVGAISGSGNVTSNRPFIFELLVNSPTSITAIFNQQLNLASAQTASNYRIQNEAGTVINYPTNPTLGGSNLNQVTLTLGITIQSEVKYYLVVNNVKNLNNLTVNTNHLKLFGIFAGANTWVWTGNTDTDWNKATNWSKNALPLITSDVKIPNRPNKPLINLIQVTVSSVEIQPNSSLTIGAQGSLTVSSSISNQAGSTGLIIESSSSGTGSLIHNSVSVDASFKRYIPGESESWHLLSSPMTAQAISPSFTPSGTHGDGTGYSFYYWHEPDTSWIYFNHTATWASTHGSTNFVVGRGYMVAYQQVNPTLVFSGILNNSMINVPVTKTVGVGDVFGANIAGNPYPSSIDWKSATGWNRSALETSGGGYNFWIWNETALNYGVYNSSSISNSGTLGTTRYIPPTQGFFVKAAQNGSFSMDNNTRVHEGSGNWLKNETALINKVSFSVFDLADLGSDEVSIEFGHLETDGATKLFSFVKEAPTLYMPFENQMFSMCLLTDTDKNPVIPLSFKAGKSGTFRMQVNFEPSMFDVLFVEDLFTNENHDLKTNTSFEFSAGDNDDSRRFVLHFKSGTFPNPHDDIPAGIYAADGSIHIDMSLLSTDSEYQFYLHDLNGQLVLNQSLMGGSVYEINPACTKGIYIARIVGKEGVKTIKIFI